MSSVLQFTTSDYSSGIFKCSYNENMTHLCKEQARFTEHHRQTLQDVFDITLRYYQNSFDTWDEEQWNLKKKCSEHVVIGYFGTFVFDSLNCLLYVYIYSTVYLFMCKLCFVIMHILAMRKYIKITKIYIV